MGPPLVSELLTRRGPQAPPLFFFFFQSLPNGPNPIRYNMWVVNHTTRITVKNFPTLFLALLVGTLAFGYMAREDNAAVARCENRGGHIHECRLIVLGR